MADKSTSHRGRVRKFDNNLTYFGMKLTTDEKEKIKNLSLTLHTTATQAVLKAVDIALAQYAHDIPTGRRVTADELLSMDKATRNKVIQSQMKYVDKDESIEDGFDIIDD
ncbi:MAG: hypothetical protein ACK4NC_05755 [Candidatus Gracilibacteria bacterium]